MKRPLIFATLILLLAIAGLLYWFISRTLDTVTLVQTLDDDSHEVIRGWAIVPVLWPVMLVTAIPVPPVVGGLALRMLSAAVDADWQRELMWLNNALTGRKKTPEPGTKNGTPWRRKGKSRPHSNLMRPVSG